MRARGRTVLRTALRWATAVLAGGVLLSAAAARAGDGMVALTFDDLPGLSLVPDQPYVNYLNDMLLRGLKRHRMPATGFVNESKLDLIDRPRVFDLILDLMGPYIQFSMSQAIIRASREAMER